jgi:hypothetical protein
MSRAPKGTDAPWRLIQFLGKQLEKILIYFLGKQLDKFRNRDAFADARRAQAARLLAQQIGPPLDHCWYRMLAREDRNAAIWPLIEDSSVHAGSKVLHDEADKAAGRRSPERLRLHARG